MRNLDDAQSLDGHIAVLSSEHTRPCELMPLSVYLEGADAFPLQLRIYFSMTCA